MSDSHSRQQLLLKSRRKIVFHETCFLEDAEVLNKLIEGDLLFFDDCLYSQYLFLKKNVDFLKKNGIDCILGFSRNIYRRREMSPNVSASCAECHDRIHNGDFSAYDSYMSIDELKELVGFDNIHLAAHGFNHLDLKNEDEALKKCEQFFNDIDDMLQSYEIYGLSTDIFVFPYAYDEILLSYSYLRRKGFRYFFAGASSRRIAIESVLDGSFQLE